MKTFNFLLIVIAAIIYVIGAPATGCGEPFGNQLWNTNGWQPIKNINEKHIQELGAWAVLEHGRYVNCRLWFHEVVSGKQQLVSGMNYELIIDASDDAGKHGKYKAEVYEQESTNTRKLLSFSKAD
ncbi:cysteine proteinase inhibitor 6-like [Lolium perenne]|uniref:cysteine proteinase inhibitor 6-like n=1 Tax=Lolium perenne TaxID=4522 RepID=UPI0021EA4C76|nr:cysteine proteinase inhibitor 6-like [Lolium perenne]